MGDSPVVKLETIPRMTKPQTQNFKFAVEPGLKNALQAYRYCKKQAARTILANTSHCQTIKR